MATTQGNLETATFGAGCFWGAEDAFLKVNGVKNTAGGYMGGTLPNPTYKDVCTDKTGYGEVAQAQYDSAVVSYEELLQKFWEIHDPTQINQQGPDHGTQYRSVIFFRTPEQKLTAQASKEALQKSGKYKEPIVTALEPASTFYRAEEYHQRYFEKNGGGICHV